MMEKSLKYVEICIRLRRHGSIIELYGWLNLKFINLKYILCDSVGSNNHQRFTLHHLEVKI